MDLEKFLRAVRRSWWLVLFSTIIGVGVAAAFVLASTKTYTATVRLFISAPADNASDISGALNGSTFTQARVKSYADIVATPEVTQAVVSELRLSLTPSQVAQELSASAPMDEVLLNISVLDPSPQRAQAIANAVGTRMATVVDILEAPEGGGPSPVKLSVVQQAVLPGPPTSPRVTLDLALGVLVGLVVGISAAVARITFDRSVRNQEAVTDSVGLITLGAIGYDPEAGKKPLVVSLSPHSQRAEAFRQLRTNLQFVDVDNPPRSLVVTSAVPREGKSTTTINLAITFAQTGLSVVLVEGDLRRPRITRYADLPQDLPGLTDVLVGQRMLREVIVPFVGAPGLSVLPAGANPPNPSELLASQNMVAIIDELEGQFDMVIIDSPPLLPVTDGAILGSVADGTLIVVRVGKTTKEQLLQAVAALKAVDVRTVGVVLNRVPLRGPDAQAYAYGYTSRTGYGDYGHKRKRGSTTRPDLVSGAAQPEPALRRL